MDPAEDPRFMQMALALGRRELGRSWPNPAVGAVIVQHQVGEAIVVGRGWTQASGRPHAETEALRRAGTAARGATMYVTLEPCSHYGRTPPCVDAILQAGIARVVSALEDPNPQVAGAGHARLREAGIRVDVGVGAERARRDHAGHFRRMREGRPHLTLKLAVSADDKVGLPGRRPARITQEAANARVHLMRAQHDAVLTGIGTVLADDPQLTCRLPGMLGRSPVRVILDSQLRLPANGKLAQAAGEAALWVVTGTDAPSDKASSLERLGARILRVPAAPSGLDLPSALRLLAAEGLTRVMLEAGPLLSTAFWRADLVDEVVLFRSPHRLGSDALDALDGIPLSAMTESPRLRLCAREMLGQDAAEAFVRVE
jgi:diaminohydroxyphosphoribosylaminopyrimidine deaminase / 5-amino-6-(5-phosphoribosylamino)uracil reductase